MNININFTGIEPTEAIKEYVTEKVESLTTFFDGIESADIDVGMKSHHHQKGKFCRIQVTNSWTTKFVSIKGS